MKNLLPLFIMVMMVSSVSAIQLISVNPYETRELPSLSSNVSLDLDGLQRTYLYCTWRIDGLGEEASLMSSEVCPETPQNFTFEDIEDYYVRIDYASIEYNVSSEQWGMTESGVVKDEEYRFFMTGIPEPPSSLLETIYNTILGYVRTKLCQLFPFLGFCG